MADRNVSRHPGLQDRAAWLSAAPSRVRSRAIAGVTVGALLLAIAPQSHAQRPAVSRGAAPAISLQLRLAVPADTQRIEAELATARSVRPQRKPISDVVVRLTAESGSIREALAAANMDGGTAARSDRQRRLMSAEILVVIGGRVQMERRAECAPWIGDIAVCTAECEGGSFAIERRRGRDEAQLALLVGRTDANSPTSRGVRLGACSEEPGEEITIVPTAGQGLARLGLRKA